MGELEAWWGVKFGEPYAPTWGVWFRGDGTLIRVMIWGPTYPDCNGWWIELYGSPRAHLSSLTALTFPL